MVVVGDAAVDILMGQEAGAMTCAAMWGAHARDPLLELKPTFVAEMPLDILGFSYQPG
jgi:phosphoglycolate phosphatase-like HAD superfamily hydrolase